ncbi:Bug family tripartite tricarboxylate transporter substrate binding protein [Bradyrhizobium cosmicum]|uniref:Bug family tripartite tricarboxylate transporter substrate binding protein n=1 Tax=Bradyrhizobium cosmicum TaxID=1404864 RepID=UPI001162C6BF|nr:tripartite tricarboxylate transporter substrate-binding protein [Bradyrhizobium cosmicum]QDP21041.1 tripartite tricarboxylate transporter substrate binding protein [Bradyrhizobium cosmicum]
MHPKTQGSHARMAISRRQALASLCAMPMMAKSASAQIGWPTQAVRVLLGQPAGSGSDPMARGLAPHLAAAFGQPFIVENMPGGGGITAAAAVARATDDHTIGIVLGGPTTTAKALNPALAYDPATDFRPISLLNRSPFVLTVHPGSFAGKQFADVIDHARAHPGSLSYASIGPGTVTHLAMEELKAQLGVDIVHVPYRGFPQATLDLVAGRCQLMFNIAAAASEHVAAGRLLAVAQTGSTRLTALPDVPTLHDLNPKFEPFFGWSGMIAPASFPESRAERLAKVVRDALASDPNARGGLDRAGSEVMGTDPAELQSLRDKEATRWIEVITRLGLRSAE